MKRILLLTIILACGFIPQSSTFAQAADAQSPAEQKAGQQARREELVRKIEDLKHAKLTNALGLDAETAPKFFAIYGPAERDIQSLAQQRNAEMKKLGQLTNGAKSDADVDPEIAKLRDLNQQIESRAQQLDADLKGVLSSRQRARLLVFEHEFNQRIRQEVAQHQVARGGTARALRQQLRQERVRNRLLRKLAKGKAAEQK
ncbi:MAG: hypothetical protein Q8922_03145 [Bacteroidota bacterium]|nr:hypothetical protein [Bacteroidota bacterium]MDP4232962.1 hypothetical protein [Bacteroidota bacterium]MDP4242006.1 hypothetical protein [Bacteroidota bacterium]MDP4286909.1 hypothetical protein [Bacteroidota bacterium]